MMNQKNIFALFIGVFIGMLAIIFIDKLLSDSANANIPFHLEKCVNSADKFQSDSLPERYSRISDCMAGNNYIFRGTQPVSHCYAESRQHIQIKHVFPTCYESPKLLTKLLNLL